MPSGGWGQAAERQAPKPITPISANIPRNRLNDVFLHYFDETIAFRADSDYTIEHLTGLYHLQFTLRAKDAGGISEPAFLRSTDDFTRWLREREDSPWYPSLSLFRQPSHGDWPGLVEQVLARFRAWRATWPH